MCKNIDEVKFVTYLGVKIDEHFSWSERIDNIISKLRILLQKFYHLRAVFYNLFYDAALIVCKNISRPPDFYIYGTDIQFIQKDT